MSAEVDREKLEHLAGSASWARLLPSDGDSTEEVQRKRRAILRVLRVQEAWLEAGRSRERQHRQLQAPASPAKDSPAQAVLAAQEQPASSGWRTARRGGQGRQLQQQSAEKGGSSGAAAAPAGSGAEHVGAGQAAEHPVAQPAAAAADADADPGATAEDEAGEGYQTPVGVRVPGPGRAAARHRATTAGGGIHSALPSSGGIPTASTDSGPDGNAAGPAGQQQAAAGRRRRRGAGTELAVGSGRLGLSAYLTMRAPRDAGMTPGSAAAPLQLASGGGSDVEGAAQQPYGRRWKAAQQQQQEQQRNPLMRLLHRNPAAAAAAAGASQQQLQQTQGQPWQSQQSPPEAPAGSLAQPSRLGPSRFAPDAGGASAAAAAATAAIPALAPASLSTLLAGLQAGELPWQQVSGAERRSRPLAGDVVPDRAVAEVLSPTQQQHHPQQAQQQQQHQQPETAQHAGPPPHGRAAQQGPPAAPAAGMPPPPPAQHPGQAPAGQASVQLPQVAETTGTLLTFATGTGALGPGETQWTLPPTPSIIKTFSPDSPATTAAAGRAEDQTAAGRRGGGSGGMQPGGCGGSGHQAAGGAPPPAAAQPHTEARRPASAAAGGTVLALRCLPVLSCVEETPQLLFPSSAEQPLEVAYRQSAEGEARQLFVAETPAEAAGTDRGCLDEGMQERQQQQGQAAAAVSAALAQAATVTGPVAALVPAHAAAATPAAGAAAGAVATTPAPAAASVAGLQLQLPLPVLQAVPCGDGQHVALLLGSYAPAGEPEHVLVLRLPADPAASLAAGAAAAGEASARRRGEGGAAAAACCGVRVVAALAVERSKWGQGVQLAPNCIQLAATRRTGLQLILSAALQLSEHPAAAGSQPAILVLSLSALRGAAGCSAGTDGSTGGGPRGGRRRAAHQALPGLLSIEFKEPLTCVALAGGNSLFASGDGPCVQRLDFDPLWRSYTWAQLPAASYRGILYEDVAQLQLYRDPEHPQRRLLLGLSSGGGLALWNADSSQLLVARMHPTYRLRSLQPVSMAQAGLTTPVKARVGAAGAAAGATEPSERPYADGPHLFVGLAEHKVTQEQHLAAVMLCAGSLQVSSSGAVAPPEAAGRPGSAAVTAAQQRLQQQRKVTAVAAPTGGSCCWLGTAAGELLAWDMRTGRSGGSSSCVAASVGGLEGPGGQGRVQACSSRSLVASACALPGDSEWALVASTAGGCCTLLARP